MHCRWSITLLLACLCNQNEGLSPRNTKSVSVDLKAESFQSKHVAITTDDLTSFTPWSRGFLSQNEQDYYGKEFDLFVRNEYKKWLKAHNKEYDHLRYPQFKENFLSQFKNDLHKGGQFFHLNEFGDLSPDEYQQEMTCKSIYTSWRQKFGKEHDPERYKVFKDNLLSHDDIYNKSIHWNKFADMKSDEFVALVSDEEFIKEEYNVWVEYYDKPHANYKIWRGNYLLQLDEIKKSHGYKSFVFDEYSDLGQEAYEKEIVTEFEYRRWCDRHAKEMSRERYAIFKENFKMSVSNKKVLNEDADLTWEEFTTMVSDNAYIKREFSAWLEQYGKQGGSFNVFKENFLRQVAALEETYCTDSFIFDEYSDVLEAPEMKGIVLETAESDIIHYTDSDNLDKVDYSSYLLEGFDMELLYQEEFKKWCQKFSKSKDKQAFETFKENFLICLEHSEKTGVNFILNEHAASTVEEYLSTVSSTENVRKEYQEWISAYDLPMEESRYKIFEKNFINQLQWSIKSGSMYQLKEAGLDDTRDESWLKEKYKEWAKKYDKSTSEMSYKIYKSHLIFQLQYNHKHQTCYTINRFGDWTQEEWEAYSASLPSKNKSKKTAFQHRSSRIPTLFYQEELPMNDILNHSDNKEVPFFVSQPHEETAGLSSFSFS